MLTWLLNLDILQGPVPWTVWAVTAGLVATLLVRRYTAGRAVRAVLALALGATLGLVISWTVDAVDAVGTPLPDGVRWWAAGCFAAVALGLVSLWDSRVPRKVVAALAIIAALLSATIGINAAFGLDRNLGDLLEISTLPAAGPLPEPASTTAAEPADLAPLYRTWHAPAGMPHEGEARQLSGAQRIPSTAGFMPRDAAIYLPPAALVPDPPALPVVVQMMGLPGSPTPTAVKTAVDAYAATHHGLGPIVIVADQLGSSRQNPGCADSAAFGGVSTYFNVDIPQWIRTHVRALPGPANWTISGYSNGGACAFLYAAQHPDVWGSLVDISGEEWPGMENPRPVLGLVFGGDRAAFDANRPAGVLAAHPGAYAGRTAVFTAGALDHVYRPHAQHAADVARAAGFTTTFYPVPGAGHVGPALSGGLDEALRVLAPVWGLQP